MFRDKVSTLLLLILLLEKIKLLLSFELHFSFFSPLKLTWNRLSD